MLYGARRNGRQHGSVTTHSTVVDFMLDITGYTSTKNLSAISVLEPGVGSGAFLLAILERLYQSSERFAFSFAGSLQHIVAVDIDADMVDILRVRVRDFLVRKGVCDAVKHASRIVRQDNFLLSTAGRFDLIVGNPPYVRHELIPDGEKAQYKKLFATFKHRSDLYIAFFEKSLSLLKEGGQLSFICADRWMKNRYGEALRALLESSYNISVIVDVNCVGAFTEKVDAYPAITLIENTQRRGYVRQGIATIDELALVKEAVLKGRHTGHAFSFKAALPGEGLASIEDQGFKIGIGVATGADAIFIKADFSNVESSLLLPIITTKDIANGEITGARHMLFNPFAASTHGLIDLEQYPQAKKYLLANKERLQKRYIATKTPKQWYKTIDRIYPELTSTPKLLIPDIQQHSSSIVFDEGHFYPHHNIYYITAPQTDPSWLQTLGAILLSDFVHRQMQNTSVLMRGGHIRWQTQNLRKLRIPVIINLPVKTQLKLKDAFRKRDLRMIDQIINQLTRVPVVTLHPDRQRRTLPNRDAYHEKQVRPHTQLRMRQKSDSYTDIHSHR
jgi:adenine-specific DNA-methyltransferase